MLTRGDGVPAPIQVPTARHRLFHPEAHGRVRGGLSPAQRSPQAHVRPALPLPALPAAGSLAVLPAGAWSCPRSVSPAASLRPICRACYTPGDTQGCKGESTITPRTAAARGSPPDEHRGFYFPSDHTALHRTGRSQRLWGSVPQRGSATAPSRRPAGHAWSRSRGGTHARRWRSLCSGPPALAQATRLFTPIAYKDTARTLEPSSAMDTRGFSVVTTCPRDASSMELPLLVPQSPTEAAGRRPPSCALACGSN